jgi:hypothetical protein
MTASFLAETSVDIRLSDNLLNHAQIAYDIGPPVAYADRHKARFPIELSPDLAGRISASRLSQADAASAAVPRLLALASDDPSLDGLHRALTNPRLAGGNGTVTARAGRDSFQLNLADLELVWEACDQLHKAHYAAYWDTRRPALARLAQDVDDHLQVADLLHKLADLTGREAPYAEIDAYLLDSDALICYSGDGDRICITAAILARFERFIYLFAHECAGLYLHNPPWWEIEPCASVCAALPTAIIDMVERCAAQYLAATLALHYGANPGYWAVHPHVEQAFASRWPQFVASPDKGIDLLLAQVLGDLSGVNPDVPGVKPLRLSVTYDAGGRPLRCAVAAQRF